MCSTVKIASSVECLLIALQSIFLIICPILPLPNFSTWCPILDLTPVIYRITRHVVIYFFITPIFMVTSLTWKFSWYYDKFLYVLFSSVIYFSWRYNMDICYCYSVTVVLHFFHSVFIPSVIPQCNFLIVGFFYFLPW